MRIGAYLTSQKDNYHLLDDTLIFHTALPNMVDKSTDNTKALLIETDPLVTKIFRQQLSYCGYGTIISVETGEEGVLLALTESPDLIIVDIELPNMNGWQLIDILQESKITQKIPVIALVPSPI